MATSVEAPPMLESGDRLTQEEFHRRYELRPDIHKAELVQGVVYVAAAVRVDEHGAPHAIMMTWIGNYHLRTRGVRSADNCTVILSEEDEVQPDVCLFRTSGERVGVERTEKGYLRGAPELVVEIAASNVSYDLHDKKESYRRAGVREYLVWRVLDKAFDWFRLQEGAYVRVEPDADGIIESAEFPGLRLNVPALLTGDYARAIAPRKPRRSRR